MLFINSIRQPILRILLLSILLFATADIANARSSGRTITFREKVIVYTITIILIILVKIQQQKEKKTVNFIKQKNIFTALHTIDTKKEIANTNAQQLKKNDPNFSAVLFLDFAQNLFYEYYNNKVV